MIFFVLTHILSRFNTSIVVNALVFIIIIYSIYQLYFLTFINLKSYKLTYSLET